MKIKRVICRERVKHIQILHDENKVYPKLVERVNNFYIQSIETSDQRQLGDHIWKPLLRLLVSMYYSQSSHDHIPKWSSVPREYYFWFTNIPETNIKLV